MAILIRRNSCVRDLSLCRDIALITAQSPPSSRKGFHSTPCGSGKRQGSPGRSWRAGSGRLLTPSGRWRNVGVRPSTKHTKALLARADERSLSHPPARRTWLHQDPVPGPLAECAGRLRRSFRMRGRAGRHHRSGEAAGPAIPGEPQGRPGGLLQVSPGRRGC